VADGPTALPALPARLDVPESVVEIVRTLEGAGHAAWCVGGALRDAVLQVPHADFDVATSAPPDQVRKLFRRTVPVGERFGTVGVLDRGGVLHEVTTFRHDVRTDGRHAEVEFGASLEEDLARRDFTINALAHHPLTHEWRDPFHGADDLARGIVRAVGEPGDRIREDYLRLLRALRFAARFDFAIDPSTWAAMRELAPGLGRLSAERVRDEWFKGLETARTLDLLARLWHASGAAAVWLPELNPGPIPSSTDAAPRDAVLLTAMLTNDSPGVLRRLKASNAEISRAEAVARVPPAPVPGDERAARRWLAGAAAATDDALRMEQLRTGRPAAWLADVERIRQRGDAVRRGDLAINGGDLLALGLTGPAVGRVLDRLLDRTLDDPALNRHETLLALARELA
jgi:tRNA nucleotidyltransferase (CCA-adding enzyme)